MDSLLDVVVAQTPAALDGPQARFDWLAKHLSDEHIRDADLLLLPELFLTGYNIGANVEKWCEPDDGPFAQKIAALSQKHNIAIHYGFAESHNGQVYNSANCMGRDGQKIGGHRKLLLPPGFEAEHFVVGDKCKLFSINGFKIGTLICYDAEFPETFRHLAKMGADLILVPTALGANWEVVTNRVIPTRAFENGVFVCYANQSGAERNLEYLGSSCIVGPNGKDIARAGSSSQFLRARLNKQQVTAAQERLPYHRDLEKLPW